jgi:predicted HD superfamily hydrolase involved in NAD metabolism
LDFSEWLVDIELGHGIWADVGAFLCGNSKPGTLAHVERVAAEAARLARRFGVSQAAAEQAGLLHDASAVISPARYVEMARLAGLIVFPEEEAYPMLLHQRLSALVASEVFHVVDESVLSAVSCHTTLRAGAARLDLVVFVADKLAWDRPGSPPYREELQAALEQSLEKAAGVYLVYLREHATGPLHPWARAALAEFSMM